MPVDTEYDAKLEGLLVGISILIHQLPELMQKSCALNGMFPMEYNETVPDSN